MSQEPLILAFDTSAAHCAAALLCGGAILAARSEEMGRGQAERLFPLLEEMLDDAGIGWRDLTAIGVGIGPGNFTGIRISVSAARGLALALEIPAIGVSSFDAIGLDRDEPHIAVVAAPRDQVYAAGAGMAPALMPRDEAMAKGLPLAEAPDGATLAQAMARIAAQRLGTANPAPAPLYIRAADAAPSRDQAPVILSDEA